MVTGLAPLAFLLAQSPVEQFRRNLLDQTFAGIHQLSWFDYALLIPYFGILVILSFYGCHRYEMIRGYFKHRRKVNREPESRFTELPPVTIQLPLYNERYVVERLLEAVTKIEYPKDQLQIQVLDDSTDETHPFTERLVNVYRSRGHNIEYRHRANRHGYKAGALQEGMASATGDFFAIFDADFVPPPDFLLRTIHHLADERVGVVQTRWTYINRDSNVLSEVQAMLLDGHFILEHVARYGGGLFFNFNGTAGILRRKMIEDSGGWQHDTLTEDSDLSYRAQVRGWKFVYLPWVECPSELPVEIYGFQVQQSRWAKGLTQVALKLLPSILRARLPWRTKLEAWAHLTPNIAYPFMIAVSALMLPVMMVRFYMGWSQWLFVDLPLIVANFWSIGAFYLVAQREVRPKDWKRSVVLMPALIAAGVGLTIINTRAVLEALFGVQSAFQRTPKYAITGRKEAIQNAAYRRRSGWLPFAEIAAGLYFVGMIAYAIDTYNFLAIPFLLLFVGGYFWAGFGTLWQEYQGKLRFERQRRLEASQVR